MIATILNVAQNGKPSVTVSFSITDDDGVNILPDGNISFEGTPCINMEFPIPLTETAISDLEATINAAVLDRLNEEFKKYGTFAAAASLVGQVSSDLVGTTQEVTSIDIGNIKLRDTGALEAK